MAAPTITAGSITTSASLNPVNFTIPISAAQTGRMLVLCNLSKDDSTVVSLVNALAFDAAGVNATLANGKINEQGITQIAREGIRSSQCGVYFVKDIDLPSTAGIYTFEPTFDTVIDRYLWICFEVLGCPSQSHDNIIQNISLIDVSATAKFSASITPTVNDCLIVDIWATSHSINTTFTSTEIAVDQVSLANAGGVVSQFTQTTALAKVMEQESSASMQRRAWTLLSFSGADSNTNISVNTQSLLISTFKATINAAKSVQVGSQALTITTHPATIKLGGNTNINVGVQALSLTLHKAQINARINRNINVAALTITTLQALITLTVNANTKENERIFVISYEDRIKVIH